MIRLNLSGLFTVGADGARLAGRPLVELLRGFHGKSVVITGAEVCGHRLSDGMCTLRPHGPEKNHANLLAI